MQARALESAFPLEAQEGMFLELSTKVRAALALVAAVGVAALAPEATQAHLGDRNNQFQTTQRQALSNCENGGNWDCLPRPLNGVGIARCYGKTKAEVPCYGGSGPYTAHSRWFVWRFQREFWLGTIAQECTDFMVITHNGRIIYDSMYDKKKKNCTQI